MRHLLPLTAVLPVALHAQIQSPLCDTLPIAYDMGSVIFTEADISFGDSMIVVQITNTSGANMAYPQMKLVPLTPLPPGMTQNTTWYTFASSWNVGNTMPAHCYFDVATPIPLDYSVTFQVWVNNLSPLLDDSCWFVTPFTINLNPSGVGLAFDPAAAAPLLWPVPANDHVHIRMSAPATGQLVILDALGSVIRSVPLAGATSLLSVDVSELAPGCYFLDVKVQDRQVIRERFCVAR